MRIEANISVSDTEKFGTKVEVKNLNSFKVVEKAIEYEIKRQIEAIENGEKIIQETRGWDENGQKTFSQRMKEGSADYRYFPDPDLPKLKISEIPEFSKENLKKEILELPWEKRKRFFDNYGIKSEDLEMYISDDTYGKFFENSANELSDKELVKLASNYITSDIVGLKKDSTIIGFGKIEINNFVELIKMVGGGEISSRGTKDILKIIQDNQKGIKITPLIRKSNLSSQRFKEYYSDLTDKNFVIERIIDNGKLIFLSEKGSKFLDKYKTIISFIEEFEL